MFTFFKKSTCRCGGELVLAQAAHDIRSPVAALSALLPFLPQIPEEERVAIRGTLQRIKAIADQMLATYRLERLP